MTSVSINPPLVAASDSLTTTAFVIEGRLHRTYSQKFMNEFVNKRIRRDNCRAI